jgi:hypothetical protein
LQRSRFTTWIWSEALTRYERVTGMPDIATCKNAAFAAPLEFEPGERWEYGISMDWVGELVEAVSDQSLEIYFRESIFTPLCMKDSGFLIGTEQKRRVASFHSRHADGGLEPTPFEMPQRPEFFMGGGGAFSTPRDYMAFLQALLNGGALHGVRILRPETVAMMMQNQIGELNVQEMRSAQPPYSRSFDQCKQTIRAGQYLHHGSGFVARSGFVAILRPFGILLLILVLLWLGLPSLIERLSLPPSLEFLKKGISFWSGRRAEDTPMSYLLQYVGNWLSSETALFLWKTLAIIATAGFGIYGLDVKSRDDRGRFTRQGMVVLAGLVVSALVTALIQTGEYMQSQRAAVDELYRSRQVLAAVERNLYPLEPLSMSFDLNYSMDDPENLGSDFA